MKDKDNYVRHEFVVNKEKHPKVAAFIEDPKNSGTIGNIIVTLLEGYLWAAKNVSTKSIEELMVTLTSLSSRTDRLLKLVEGGSNQAPTTKRSGSESHKGALDNL